MKDLVLNFFISFIALLFLGISPSQVSAQATNLSETVALLVEALDEGSAASLSKLDSDALSKSLAGSYQLKVLPILQRQGVESLLSRFSVSDWKNWTEARHLNDGNPSDARLYLDDLWTVNKDIASYLETAAYLLHALYTQSADGEVFDINKAYETYGKNFSLRTLKSALGDTLVPSNAKVVSDKDFLKIIEDYRLRFVALYIKRNPGKIKKAQELLGSLGEVGETQELTRTLLLLFSKLAPSVSKELRAQFFELENKNQTIEHLALQIPITAEALSYIYLLGVLDAFEKRDFKKSEALLERSKRIRPNLKIQQQIQAFLEKSKEASLETKANKQSEKKSSKDPLKTFDIKKPSETSPVETASTEAEDDSELGTSPFLILFLIVVVAVPAALIFARKRALETSHQKSLEVYQGSDSGDSQNAVLRLDEDPWQIPENEKKSVNF